MTLVFLIILMVAATALVVLVALGRVTLGDFRFPGLREGSVQGASPAGSLVPPVPGTAGERATETGGPELDAEQNGDEPRPVQSHWPLGRREKRREEPALYDETDVERAVRDRLYGRHGRRD